MGDLLPAAQLPAEAAGERVLDMKKAPLTGGLLRCWGALEQFGLECTDIL